MTTQDFETLLNAYGATCIEYGEWDENDDEPLTLGEIVAAKENARQAVLDAWEKEKHDE